MARRNTVTAAVMVAGALVAFALFIGFRQGPFEHAALTSALLADFGAPRPPADSNDEGEVLVVDPVLVALPNGHVVETIHLLESNCSPVPRFLDVSPLGDGRALLVMFQSGSARGTPTSLRLVEVTGPPTQVLSLPLAGCAGSTDVFIEFSDPPPVGALVRTMSFAPPAALPSLSVLAGSRRQDDPQWANIAFDGVGLGRVGTVPSAIATVLSAFGHDARVPDVAREMARSGAWDPIAGGNWTGIQGYLTQQGCVVRETDMHEATGGEASHSLFLVALKDVTDQPPAETLLVISGYEPKRDDFTVIDPRRGLRHVTWEDMTKGDPWILGVTACAQH
jgi:hypothetical protein